LYQVPLHAQQLSTFFDFDFACLAIAPIISVMFMMTVPSQMLPVMPRKGTDKTTAQNAKLFSNRQDNVDNYR